MPAFKDLRGFTFGRLRVIRVASHGTRTYWRCECICGKLTDVYASSLARGLTRSCGCLRREATSKRVRKHGHAVGRKTATYNVWKGMRKRCSNPNDHKFKDYGGRGIRVCKRWEKFENFLADMGEKPKGKSIDRVNNNGNYEPENCRWATPTEQARNSRKVRILDYKGTALSLAEWAEKLGLCPKLTSQRIVRDGWSTERALFHL
jgi:hypothetical protein